MAHAAATGTPTTLAKIAGVYSISFKQQAAAGTGQVRVLVAAHTACCSCAAGMERLFGWGAHSCTC